MCNINIIKDKTGKYKNLLDILNTITNNSYYFNDDGEGFIGLTANKECFIGKSIEKIDYKKKFKLIATHQRKSTSGFGFDNIHPHESAHFLMMHNGVISNNSDAEKSDSKLYLDEIEKEYCKHYDILKTIKNVTDRTFGSYSVVLYDKNTKKMYYYKNFVTSMYFIETKDILIMSTNMKNMEYVCKKLKINEKLIGSVEEGVLFQIDENYIKTIGNIERNVFAPDYSAWWLPKAFNYMNNLWCRI